MEIDRELLKKNNVYDEIILEEGKAKLVRRIGLTEYHKTYILPKEVVIDLGTVEIQLFKGENYIYIKDEQNNPICAQYIVENEFTDLYATKREVNSSIEQKADEINLQVSEKYVGNDEIIAKINISPEEIKLQANKIALEGYTTINGGFKIDENGNAEIANGAVKINNQGIQMSDNTGIIGGDGIYTNLQYFAQEGYRDVGYMVQMDEIYQAIITIYADIPSNFKIDKAFITLRHQPITWKYYPSSTSTTQSTDNGYCRNIEAYIGSMIANQVVTADAGLDFLKSTTGTKTTLFNNKTFSANAIEVAKSADCKNYLTSGALTVFNIGSTTPASNIASIKTAYQQTGYLTAVLTVFGFLKPE